MVVPEDTGDEVGTLARAFRKLVSDLKEKAALEALIAEMQRRPGDETHQRFAASPTTTSALPDGGRMTAPAAVTVSPLGGEAPPGPKPGAVFASRYEILSLLGEGGMGRVYRANDRQLDEEVALTVLGSPTDNLTGTGAPSIAAPEAVASLKEEIRIARRITHPNVVRTHDFGEAAGLNFITMEYVPGTTLRELLRARKTIDLAPGLQIAKQICRGLMAVHEAGNVHRDLKPHNVMVMGNGVVKLMDFGIAKLLDGRREKTTTTEGTPFYMSPEQFRGEPPDPRSDLYSAGLLFWEIFAGRHCFTATDIEDLIQKQLHSIPPWLKTVRPDVPDLSRTIAACVEKDPEKRPRSARDLERVLSNVNLL
jgi:serine/threonine-protein kinase